MRNQFGQFKKGHTPSNKGTGVNIKEGVFNSKFYVKTRREHYNKLARESYKRNRNKIRERSKKRLGSWEGFIPLHTKCEICSKDIYFHCGDVKKAIHFDHKKGGTEVIKKSPTNWLSAHIRNPEREKIWNSCKFGMLCQNCNKILLTKEREDWVRKIYNYVFKKGGNDGGKG